MNNDPIYNALQEGEVKVTARFARRDNEEGDAPDYGPPKNVLLDVRRRQASVKHGGVLYEKGTLISVYVLDFDWAEYGERDYCSKHHEFLIEEWRMQILSIGWAT